MPRYVIVDADKLDSFEHMVADFLEDTPDVHQSMHDFEFFDERKEEIRERITLLDKEKSQVFDYNSKGVNY